MARPAVDRVLPLFIRVRDLPNTDDDNPISTREICGGAEKLVGYGTMEGAQIIGGLWRIYPKTRAARIQLLISGMAIRNLQIRFHDENPFLVRNTNNDGAKVDTTKVFISNLPISLSNTEIEDTLVAMKCQLVSKLVDECDRDSNGKLTRWKTGRRFIYIAVPTTPLPNQVTIGPFTARIYHREQKLARQLFCGNCFGTDHRKNDCTSEVVCRRCKQPGHKSGEVLCQPQTSSPQLDQRETTRGTPEIESVVEASDESDSESEKELSSSQEAGEIKQKKQRVKRKKESGRGLSSSNSDDDRKTPERPAKVLNTQDTPTMEFHADTT